MERICSYANCDRPVGQVKFALSRVEAMARELGYCSDDHRWLEQQRRDDILRTLARDAENLSIYD